MINNGECPYILEERKLYCSIDRQNLDWYLAEGDIPELTIMERELVISLGARAVATIGLRSPEITHQELGLSPGHWPSQEKSLVSISAHQDAGSGLRRFEFVDASHHSAVHVVSDAARTTPDYCAIHAHDAVAELNVIIPGSDNGLYNVYQKGHWHIVDQPAVLWFPAGEEHCAIARRGSAVFFVMRFNLPEGVLATESHDLDSPDTTLKPKAI